MRWWQRHVPDADAEAILRDRGPEVFEGFYVGGDRRGRPVAPTAPLACPSDHDKVNEGRT